MKSSLIYSLMILCFAQPVLAQHFESDADFAQQAVKQLQSRPGRPQPATRQSTLPKQPVSRQRQIARPTRVVQNNSFARYGYRTGRNTVRSSYGWRPQRAQLMPQGYSQEMLQQKMLRLQQMQQRLPMMGGAGGGAEQQPQLPMMGGAAGTQQQQQKQSLLQTLMGGQAPQQQQQGQPTRPQFNRSELLKTFFGNPSAPE